MKWIRYEHGFKSIHQGMAITAVFFLFSFVYLQVWLAACFAAVFAMLDLSEHLFFKGWKRACRNFSCKAETDFDWRRGRAYYGVPKWGCSHMEWNIDTLHGGCSCPKLGRQESITVGFTI